MYLWDCCVQTAAKLALLLLKVFAQAVRRDQLVTAAEVATLLEV